MGKYTWEYGDKVYYTASAIGSCSLALYYDRQGIDHEPTPQWLLDKYQEGVDNEARILDMLYSSDPKWKLFTPEELANRGFEFGEFNAERGVDYSQQVRCRAAIGDSVVVQGHTDGVAYHWVAGDPRQGEIRGVEAKAFGESYWNIFQRKGLSGFPLYQWQVSVLMKGTGLPFLLVVGHKDDNGIVQEIAIEEVNEPPIRWAQVIGKILGIEGRLRDNNPPTCEIPLMYPCPFYPYHEEPEGIEGIDNVKVVLLETLAAEYERHGRIAKDHNALKKQVGATIAEFFDEEFGKLELGPQAEAEGGKGPRTVTGDNLKVTDVQYWQEGEPDTAAMKKDGIDVDKYRKRGYVVRYPKVTKRSNPKAEVDADPFQGLSGGSNS